LEERKEERTRQGNKRKDPNVTEGKLLCTHIHNKPTPKRGQRTALTGEINLEESEEKRRLKG
jgi:hypothetical protein